MEEKKREKNKIILPEFLRNKHFNMHAQTPLCNILPPSKILKHLSINCAVYTVKKYIK